MRSIIKNFAPYGLVNWWTGRGKGKIKSVDTFQADFNDKAKLLEDCGRFSCEWEDRLPCLGDATELTIFDPHYIYHPAWAIRRLARNMPSCHYDVGSSLAFVSMVSAFLPVKFFDYRPVPLTLSQLSCGHADLLNLPFEDESIESLSCMHVVEHVGLERYGDSFDPQGDIKATKELARVLKPSGILLFVVPVGKRAIIQYNAHRIYTYSQIISEFVSLQLRSFSFITDSGVFIEHANVTDVQDSHYGCGCFEFVK